jgi:hypothetical protein
MLFLDGGILPHQRCGGFSHLGNCSVFRATLSHWLVQGL